MKFKYLFILLMFLCLPASQARAGIRPSFDLDTSSWNATDIVVATEGKKIDGVFRVLETWKGELNVGDTIKVPELASFAPEASRVVSDEWPQKEKTARIVVTGERMVLFLKREADESAEQKENGVPLSSASIKWVPTGFFDEFKVSVVWIEQGKSFAFVQVINPGPSRLISLGTTEDELKNRALAVTDIERSLLQAVTIADPATRAAALEPFARHELYLVREDAFKQLMKCDRAALPVLRRMLSDDTLLDIHSSLVKVVAEAGKNEAASDLAGILEKDLKFWKNTGPVLEKGWWNGAGFDSLEKAVPLRNRYSRDYEAILALRRRPQRSSEPLLTEFRDFWNSSPQLGGSGLDQLGKACDEALLELDRLKVNTKAIRFEGLRSFGESELLRELREEVGGLNEVSDVTPDWLEKAKAAIHDYLIKRGHLHATVAGVFDAAAKAVTFVIDEGKRTRVADIGFQGNEVFQTEQLRQQMTGCLTEHGYPDYDAETFDWCLRRLNNVVRSKGYLQAQLGDPEFKESKDGLVFTIHVDEGRLYRLGKISINGSTILTPDQIRVMILKLKEGDIANGELIGEALYTDLKKYYGNHGFIEYTAEVVPTFKGNPKIGSEGIVDLEVTIEEGKQFKIDSIKFSGIDVPRRKLLDLLLIREGDVFNQELFERSIQKLNDSGLGDQIDQDRDVDYRTDGARGLVSLEIKVGHEFSSTKPKDVTLRVRQPESPR